MEKKKTRRSTTSRRYKRIERAVYLRLGKMPAMKIYAEVAVEMDISEETVRRVMWELKKNKEKK